MSATHTPRALSLDSNILVWLDNRPQRLSAPLLKQIQTSAQVYASAVSAWELSIKQSLARLKLARQVSQLIQDENLTELPITAEHGEAVRQLPLYHRDPFDRLLIVQATIENLILVTANKASLKYGVPIILV